MKRILCILLLLILAICGCTENAASSASAALPPEETVQTLFEEATRILRTYFTDESFYSIDEDFDGTATIKGPGGETVFSEPKVINGIRYYKTALLYQQVVDKYSEVFTGEALDSFLSEFFCDVDGLLYIVGFGGASGIGIENITITYLNQSDGEYYYRVTYIQTEGAGDTSSVPLSECHFSVKKVDGDYKISMIDYLFAFYERFPYQE